LIDVSLIIPEGGAAVCSLFLEAQEKLKRQITITVRNAAGTGVPALLAMTTGQMPCRVS